MNYVDIEIEDEQGEDGATIGVSPPLQPQISFSSVDYHVGAGEPEPPMSNGLPPQTAAMTADDAPDSQHSVSSGLPTPFINELRGEAGKTHYFTQNEELGQSVWLLIAMYRETN